MVTLTAPVGEINRSRPVRCRTRDGHWVRIRPSTRDDARQIKAAVDAVCAEQLYMVTERYVSTPQWEHVLENPDTHADHLMLVSELDGQVVGWCRVFSEQSSHKTNPVGDVGIGLLQSFREMGIGTALIRQALEWAQRQQLCKLTANTFSTNGRAQHVFGKAGFVKTGARYRQYKVKGVWVDDLFLERRL